MRVTKKARKAIEDLKKVRKLMFEERKSAPLQNGKESQIRESND